jgi:hypothetical protein
MGFEFWRAVCSVHGFGVSGGCLFTTWVRGIWGLSVQYMDPRFLGFCILSSWIRGIWGLSVQNMGSYWGPVLSGHGFAVTGPACSVLSVPGMLSVQYSTGHGSCLNSKCWARFLIIQRIRSSCGSMFIALIRSTSAGGCLPIAWVHCIWKLCVHIINSMEMRPVSSLGVRLFVYAVDELAG